jgi:GMP synthase-like glutamine amidotransferase
VTSFETAAGELPPLDGTFDAFVLSGSRHGAYEPLPWIADLLAWTRAAAAARQRLLGVCFGHQARRDSRISPSTQP